MSKLSNTPIEQELYMDNIATGISVSTEPTVLISVPEKVRFCTPNAPVYTNRLTSISSKSKGLVYKFSIIPLDRSRHTSKEHFKQVLRSTQRYQDVISIKEDTNILELCTNNILCPSVFNKNAQGKTKEDVKLSNFIFLDIDSGLRIEEARNILDGEELSYILFSSMSHSDEVHKYHLLFPTLQQIKDDETYKAYWNYLHQLLGNHSDIACNHQGRACYPSALEDLIVINSMFKNDVYLPASELNEYRRVTQGYAGASESGDPHPVFIEMIANNRPDLIIEDMTDRVIRFKRDSDDPVGNLFCYYNEAQVIHDLTQDSTTDLLFSNDEFHNAVDSQEVRQEIQDEITTIISEHIEHALEESNTFEDEHQSSSNKTVIVANEGVGKSTAVLKACETNFMIFAVHTLARIEELKDDFKKRDIPVVVCVSNETIMRSVGVPKEIIDLYKGAMDKGYSTADFVESHIVDKVLRDKVHYERAKNNRLLRRRDINILITTQKLKYLLRGCYGTKLSTIVLDEFDVSYFHKYSTKPLHPNQEIWDTERTFFYNRDIVLYKNDYNFLRLLADHSVVILSTEKSKVERTFYGRSKYKVHNLSRKLIANNVTYYLTHSTSKREVNGNNSYRDKAIMAVNDIRDITMTISDSNNLADKTHMAVRGSNAYSKENTLVICHYPGAEEEYLFYLTCESYYKYFDSRREIQIDIQQTLMECQTSQSIGRNSGFRDKGAECSVVLPSLASNSRYAHKLDLNLNYVSSNVLLLNEAA